MIVLLVGGRPGTGKKKYSVKLGDCHEKKRPRRGRAAADRTGGYAPFSDTGRHVARSGQGQGLTAARPLPRKTRVRP